MAAFFIERFITKGKEFFSMLFVLPMLIPSISHAFGLVSLCSIGPIIAVLVLGVGMCMCLVWQQIIWGTLVGLLGIIMLIALIPMIKGIK